MTTILLNRNTKEIGADTQNTKSDYSITRVCKIERLSNGWYFLGSGHNAGISLARGWAASGFVDEPPDWSNYLEHADDWAFDCIAIDPVSLDVYLIDDELVPYKTPDRVIGVGSGAAYGIGALLAGSTMLEALRISAERDAYTSAPFEVITLG